LPMAPLLTSSPSAVSSPSPSHVRLPRRADLLCSYLQRGNNVTAFPDGFRMCAKSFALGCVCLRCRTGSLATRHCAATLEQQAVSFVCLAYSQGKQYPELPYVRFAVPPSTVDLTACGQLPPYDCPDGLRASQMARTSRTSRRPHAEVEPVDAPRPMSAPRSRAIRRRTQRPIPGAQARAWWPMETVRSSKVDLTHLAGSPFVRADEAS
jgi:hypothetical protein